MSADERRAMLHGAVYCSVCGSELKVFETYHIVVEPCAYCLKKKIINGKKKGK